ncbi:MAG: hypothetical protein EP298_11530 [Gammaproteobacteria bacterium]|nr:MAG: hypothetical protein EP298_11530 [Gammaproteobacteria bacterium]UTW42106.1 hypothetical protein KFE69_11490 [bacterium SCSIO 12844]
MKQTKKLVLGLIVLAFSSVSFASETKLPTPQPKFEPDAQYQVEKYTSNQIIVEALKGFKGGLVNLEKELKGKKVDVAQVTLLLNAIQARQNQMVILQNQRIINQNQKIIQLLEAQKNSLKNAP